MKKLVLVFAVIATASLVSSCAKRQARIEAEEQAIESAEGTPVNVEAVVLTADTVIDGTLITDTAVVVGVTPAE